MVQLPHSIVKCVWSFIFNRGFCFVEFLDIKRSSLSQDFFLSQEEGDDTGLQVTGAGLHSGRGGSSPTPLSSSHVSSSFSSGSITPATFRKQGGMKGVVTSASINTRFDSSSVLCVSIFVVFSFSIYAIWKRYLHIFTFVLMSKCLSLLEALRWYCA